MSNSRMTDFRKRQLKENTETTQHNASEIKKLFNIVLGLASRVYKSEQRLNHLFPTAKIADWRSLAIMKVLSENPAALAVADGKNSFEAAVVAKADELQISNFEIESIEDDREKGLIEANDLLAEKDLYAIACLRVFKGDRELTDQRIVRTKIHLGSNEMFPELDEAIMGMKVGETKTFKLDLMGQTDSAEVSLLGLRKKEPVSAPSK